MRRRLAWTPPATAGRNRPASGSVDDAANGSASSGSTPEAKSASRPSAPSDSSSAVPAGREFRHAPRPPRRFDSPEALGSSLRGAAYVASEGLGTAAFLALSLGKPLLLEGAPGVGKTEAGKALAEVLGRDLIRLQCYEGMDSSAALYEWNYPAQMLALRRAGERDVDQHLTM